MFSYDQVPYQSLPFAQSHPDRLAVIATLFGLTPQPIDQCRVLELGCAAGGNLIPMAEMFPDSQFLGIDLSERQLTEGHMIIEQLGLNNIELLHCDIRDVNAEFGVFDYIIVHGVYSWVADDVQQKILQICRDRMTPNGVAYISYNTYPGWRMRGMIRDMLVYHTQQFDEPQERVDQARALLGFLSESIGQDRAYGAYLKEELDLFAKLQDHYLYHEHLEDINQPVYFHEFIESAERHDLQFLGEADFHMMAYWNFGAKIKQTLQKLSRDLSQVEQYMDFLRNRTFRQSLLCHRHHVLERTLKADDIANLYIASSLAPTQAEVDVNSAESVTFEQGENQVTTTKPMVKAIHMQLHRMWPLPIGFHTLLTHVNDSVANDQIATDKLYHQLGEHLIRCYASGVVALSTNPAQFVTMVSDQPAVSPFARLQAASGTLLTNRKHGYVSLDSIGRHIVCRLDGSNDHAEILLHLQNLVEQGEITLKSEDEALTKAQVKAVLSKILDHTLNQLANLALLIK